MTLVKRVAQAPRAAAVSRWSRSSCRRRWARAKCAASLVRPCAFRSPRARLTRSARP